MTKLTADYFVNELLIPGINGNLQSERLNLAKLTAMINKYEPIFLEKLMGTDLYAKYSADSLVSGIYYDLFLQIYDTALFLSPAANYVYFMYWRTFTTQTTSTGETQAKQENSTGASIVAKMINAWNEMSARVDKIREWIMDNDTNYPEFSTDGMEEFGLLNPAIC